MLSLPLLLKENDTMPHSHVVAVRCPGATHTDVVHAINKHNIVALHTVSLADWLAFHYKPSAEYRWPSVAFILKDGEQPLVTNNNEQVETALKTLLSMAA